MRILHLCTSRTFVRHIDRVLLHLVEAGHEVHLAAGMELLTENRGDTASTRSTSRRGSPHRGSSWNDSSVEGAGPSDALAASAKDADFSGAFDSSGTTDSSSAPSTVEPGTGEPIQLPGVTLHHIPFSRRIDLGADGRALGACLGLMRKLRPDLVHAHNPKASLIAMTAANMARVPRRVYHVHGLPYYSQHGVHRRLFIEAERATCRQAHRVLCVSPSVLGALHEDCGVPTKKAAILGHGSAQGIDCEHYRREAVTDRALALRDQLGLDADAPLVLFCGRYQREKGLDSLEQIWPLVRAQHPRARLLLVGRADEATPFDTTAVSGLEGATVLPFMDDPRPAYAAAQLHVLPSLREGLPTSVLEAAAMEVPSLVSNTLGCVDAVERDKTGRIVDSPTVAAWARAINAMLADGDGRRQMGAAARAWVCERFAPAGILRDLDECYRELGIEAHSTSLSRRVLADES